MIVSGEGEHRGMLASFVVSRLSTVGMHLLFKIG